MKVLVLHSELGILRGGGENFTRNLFTAFAVRGHQIAAAFVTDRRARYPVSLPPCINAIPIRGWWSRKFGQATLSSISGYLSSTGSFRQGWDRVQEAICWRIIRWHDRRFQRRIRHDFARRWNEFDAVYVHGNAGLASEVARYRPTVLRLPGPLTAELTPILRRVHVVCANGDTLSRIRAFLGDHAVELPIGLDEHLFKPGSSFIRSALGWTGQHWVVGYVGRLTHVKGVDLLAAAFHELSETVANVRLLMIGDGEEARSINSILAKEIARGIVHIEPAIDHEHLPDWYRAMDLLVMPSRYENFSNAVLEAMGCGIPFLASAVGGNRSLDEIGAGWLFEPGSISSLKASLCRIIGKRADLKAHGEVAARYARERYSWAASGECLERIITSRLGVRV